MRQENDEEKIDITEEIETFELENIAYLMQKLIDKTYRGIRIDWNNRTIEAYK